MSATCRAWLVIIALAVAVAALSCKSKIVPPEIHSITPNCSGESGGIEATIEGNSSILPPLAVDFGGTPISALTTGSTPATTVGSTTFEAKYFIHFQIPRGKAGDVVEVSVSSALGVSNKLSFSYETDPEITSINPNKGSIWGGTPVQITGKSFTAPAEAFLDNAPIEDLVLESSTSMRGVTTPHDAGTVSLTLICTPETCPRSAGLPQCFEYVEESPPSVGTSMPTGGSWQYVAIGDVTNDGANDIVVAVYDESVGTSSVLVIQSSTTLLAPVTLPIWSKPRGVVLADFDGANGLDVAVPLEATDQVAVLLNDGGGIPTSALIALNGVGSSPLGITSADLDSDGNTDIAAPISDQAVSALLGNGDGTFGSALTYTVPGATTTTTRPVAIAAADLDADKDADIAVASETSDEAIVLYNTPIPGGGLTFTQDAMESGEEPKAILLADVDADGDVDVATVDYVSGQLSLWLGSSTGALGGLTARIIQKHPVALAIGRFAPSSLAIGYEDNLVDVRDGPTGTAVLFTLVSAKGQVLSLATGDVDSDGVDDIVVGKKDDSSIVIVRSTETTIF